MKPAKCPVHMGLYTDCEGLTPMIQECGHTLCWNCANKLYTSGELKCPVCQSSTYKIDTLRANFALINGEVQLCSEHKHPLENCCVSHAVLFCQCCDHASAQCIVRVLFDDDHAIREDLENTASQLIGRYKPVPSSIQQSFDRRTRLRVQDLCDLIHRLQGLAYEYLCSYCGEVACYLSTTRLQYCCESCAKANCASEVDQVVELSDTQSAIKALSYFAYELVPKCHYYSLTVAHYQVLCKPSNLQSLLEVTREISGFVDQPEASNLPGAVVCPWCVTKREPLRMRRLPCKGIFHAICDQCFAGKATVTCRLDQKEWCSNEVVPVRISSVFTPSNSFGLFGLQVPAFVPYHACMYAIDLFSRLLPAEELPAHFCDHSTMAQAYEVKFGRKSQVEVLSFSCSKTITLAGLGITGPVAGQAVSVEFVKVYFGAKASGNCGATADCQSLRTDSPVTDIYLPAPLQIPAASSCTVKVKIAPPSDSRCPVQLFAGNYLSRPEPLAGVDGSEWTLLSTEGIAINETSDYQCSLRGPIVRLIYQA